MYISCLSSIGIYLSFIFKQNGKCIERITLHVDVTSLSDRDKEAKEGEKNFNDLIPITTFFAINSPHIPCVYKFICCKIIK